MEFLHIISPILVGSVIGYFTNYIAIKMLFRPKKEIYLGSWKLPFTPGVIPKNKKRLARAVGNAVSDQLITKEDLMSRLTGEEVKQVFARSVTEVLMREESLLNGKTLEELVGEEAADSLADTITDGVLIEINNADLLPVIRTVGNHALRDYLRNPMIAMFLNESMVEGIYARLDASIKEYVNAEGRDALSALIGKKCSDIMEGSVCDALTALHVSEEQLQHVLGELFDACIKSCAGALIDQVDLRQIVIEKIEAMPVDDLEALVMSVMKHELNTVINLGAVIGAVIGAVNLLI